MGGAIAAIESGYMKAELVKSNTDRLKPSKPVTRSSSGVNGFTETEPSPLSSGDANRSSPCRARGDGSDRAVEAVAQGSRQSRGAGRAGRVASGRAGGAQHHGALHRLRRGGRHHGEWGETLRQVFGQYRAPTGVGTVIVLDSKETEEVRRLVEALASRLARAPKLLIGKPGLDGHSNGAEQIAVRAAKPGSR